ncbi:MAG: decaprenyl-phosphate phosphoribosyltransferase [Planctomycetota bacterium]
MAGGVIGILRPREWIKNGFVLAPLVFSATFRNPVAAGNAVLAAGLFCVAASLAYVLNDLHDAAEDRRHPAKSRTRPLAAGTLSPGAAFALGVVLAALLAGGAFLLPAAAGTLALYMALNVAYTLWIRDWPVADLFAVAAGFVLRAHAGAAAIPVPLSSWMFATTFALALFLVAVKRRQELKSAASGRAVLARYTPELLERFVQTAASATVAFYGIFVITQRPRLVLTLPVVLFGFYRYWHVVETRGEGESPADTLFRDAPLVLAVTVWAVVCVWVMRGGPG